MFKKLFSVTALVALFVGFSGVAIAECTNDTWNKVMERGKVVIGVKGRLQTMGISRS